MPVIATKKKVKLHQIYSEKESEMFKNRKIKVLGMAVLLVAVVMFVVGPAKMPASVQLGSVEHELVFFESDPSGAGQYHLSERGPIAYLPSALEIYF